MAHKHGMLDEAQLRLATLRAEARARGEAMLDEVKDRGGDLLKDVQGRGSRAMKDAKLWIIENPAEAVSLAFVAGVIATSLFRKGED
jgi:ElaB/YqjD/DUF883 family membrane-anchored ribosome-binding protein